MDAEMWVIYLLIGLRRDRCRGEEVERMKVEGERKKAMRLSGLVWAAASKVNCNVI